MFRSYPSALVIAAAFCAGCGDPVPRVALLTGVDLRPGMSPTEATLVLGRPDSEASRISRGHRVGIAADSVFVGDGVVVREFGYGPLAGPEPPRHRLRLVFENGRLTEWDRVPITR